MTVERREDGSVVFICGRGQSRCSGIGQAAVMRAAVPTHKGTVFPPPRETCPVCGKVDVATYETGDGRRLVLPH